MWAKTILRWLWPRTKAILATGLVLLLNAPISADTGPVFVDVTTDAGVDYLQWDGSPDSDSEVEYFTGGAAAGDVDGDGYPDLYVTRLDAPDILFRNRGDGRFEDHTNAAGLGANLSTNGAAMADIDNDGDLDLYVTTVGDTRHYLYVNDGTGHFTEEGLARNAVIATGKPHQGFSTAFGDYDRDGYLDMHVTEWGNLSVSPPELKSHARLLRNLGQANPGHFEDTTLASHVSIDNSIGSSPGGSVDGVFAFTSTFADFDRDGLPDLAVAADVHTSRLYWNNGDGTFTRAPDTAGIGTDENGMGSAVADYNGDGQLDWFVTAIYDAAGPCSDLATCNWDATGNRLYQNNGDRTFSDATDAAGVRQGGWGWGATFFDYDNDADQDLTMTNGVLFTTPRATPFHDDPMRLWQNDGGVFTEVSQTKGLTDTGSGKGILVFDFDLDGDLDLFVVNNAGHPKLYRNDQENDNAFLRVDTEGIVSNRDGIGAFITVTPDEGGSSQTHQIIGGSNYLAQSELAAHFGLGSRTDPLFELTIQWPSGMTQVFSNVPVNATIDAVEPVPEIFNGTLQINAGDSRRLENEAHQWTMAGTLNLGGTVMGDPATITGRIDVTGEQGAVIDATITFSNGSLATITDPTSSLALLAPVTIQAGAMFSGQGTLIAENALAIEDGAVVGLTVQANGELTIGSSPGAVSVNELSLLPTSTLYLDLLSPLSGDDPSPGVDFDHVNVDHGKVTLDGTLVVNLIGDVMPQIGNAFPVITAGTRMGQFEDITGVFIAQNLTLAPVYDAEGTPGLTLVAARPGDVNFDGFVNMLDLAILGANFGQSSRQWVTADFTLDGQSNILDLAIIGANWTVGSEMSFSQAVDQLGLPSTVPAPGTLGILGIGGLSLLGRRRTRSPNFRPTLLAA